MKVLAVVGPSDAGKTTLVERLVKRLVERGPVGTVTHLDSEPSLGADNDRAARHRAAGATRTTGLADSTRVETGDRRTLSAALDDLAVECEYAVVDGFEEARLPKIVLGEAGASEAVDDGTGEVLISAPAADDVAIEDALAAIEAVDHHECLASLVARVKASPLADRSGAIATFTGRVREREGPDDDPTEYLEFERYDGIAFDRMDAIRDDLEARDGVYDVQLHHRTGVVEASEDIVFVAVLAGHRPEAFRAVEDGINRLKEEVPLFKKEVTVTDEFWAHEH